MQKLLIAVLCAVGCAACSAAMIGSNGHVLRGTATAALNGSGTFSVTDGKLTCSGSYNALDKWVTISMPVLCNDGRKGIITATRQLDGLNGSGRLRLSDGSEADFMFETAAASF